MANGDSKVCAVVRDLLPATSGMHLLEARDILNATKFVVGNGSLHAGILVYNSGKIVVEGRDSALRELCLELKRRAEGSALGDLVTQSRPMAVCPMNRERCSRRQKIDSLYGAKRVFVDVPYNDAYVEYEKTIVATLERRLLVPVLAKDRMSSDILLCKVCYLIQTCQYGVADISWPSLNVPYELGLMHALGMNCAILKSVGATQPADIQGKEHIAYQTCQDLSRGLDKWLADNTLATATA